METLKVECLSCGAERALRVGPRTHDECPRCGYLGWADSRSLTETLRRTLRERPLAHRRTAGAAT